MMCCFRCVIPGYPNDTYYHAVNSAHQALLNTSLAWDPDLGESGAWAQCDVTEVDEVTGDRTPGQCSQWVYDTSVFSSTVVSKVG